VIAVNDNQLKLLDAVESFFAEEIERDSEDFS
jgi:hypothetical protein